MVKGGPPVLISSDSEEEKEKDVPTLEESEDSGADSDSSEDGMPNLIPSPSDKGSDTGGSDTEGEDDDDCGIFYKIQTILPTELLE